MILTLTTTHAPATDLGYLLAKNPARCQTFELAFGRAHVFYPEASPECCTAVLLMDLDPIGLVRGRRNASGETFSLAPYVNDRPYVASSFYSVAIARVFASALRGESRERPELARTAIPLAAELPAVSCRGGADLLRRLFEPLGYAIDVHRHPLDEAFPDWGEGTCFRLRLEARCKLSELLTHLYVLLPVLDDQKHYWVGEPELEKLLAKGQGWLAEHPARETIVERYLKHRRPLVRDALARLVSEEDPDLEEGESTRAQEEARLEAGLGLNERRIAAVVEALRGLGARRVVDLGCGEGRLLQALLDDPAFERIVGFDVSSRALDIAAKRLDLERLPPRRRDRIDLFQGALTYRDARFAGYDAACLVEVIEHIDLPRLSALERVVFEHARPGSVVVTTPNVEYNARFPALAHGTLRHRDHRFEWTRAEFGDWARRVGAGHGYAVHFVSVGDEDPVLGAPTQMAVFTR